MYYEHEETAQIFTRMVIDGLLTNTIDPRTAGAWATYAAHYGHLAIQERDLANALHQQEATTDLASGTTILRSLLTYTKQAYRVPLSK